MNKQDTKCTVKNYVSKGGVKNIKAIKLSENNYCDVKMFAGDMVDKTENGTCIKILRSWHIMEYGDYIVRYPGNVWVPMRPVYFHAACKEATSKVEVKK